MNTLSSITWTRPPVDLNLGEDELHVWGINLANSAGNLDSHAYHLSVEERERAGRFHFDRDRKRFILSHGSLREILGNYLDLPAEVIVFGLGEHGKPNLDPVPNNGGTRFNLSHSGDLVLIAVARYGEVGVDVEKIRLDIELERLAKRFFSADEAEDLMALESDLRLPAFFRCWTRKEAYIKAHGRGLSIPLSQFRVSLEPEVPPALLANWDDPQETSRWFLHDIDLGEEYLGALAVEGKQKQIRYWSYFPDSVKR
jgi:4'-phosphopantetheinyl transferase